LFQEPLNQLLVAVILLAGGLVCLRQWREIGGFFSEVVHPEVLFGPVGEKVLIPIGLIALGAGTWTFAQALQQLI